MNGPDDNNYYKRKGEQLLIEEKTIINGGENNYVISETFQFQIIQRKILYNCKSQA